MTEKTGTSLHQSSEQTSLKYMLLLSAPMIVTSISFTIMQFVDRFMVSRLGTDALAAILPAGMVSFLPASFAIGVITSVNTFVSQSFGRGEKKECSKYCWQAIYMGLTYMAVTTAILWPLAPGLFGLQGLGENVVHLEVTYFRIVLCGLIIAVFLWAGGQFFMGVHRPVVIMCAALCGQITNVAGNYMLIFGKFGLPALGIAGAGYGTFIGIVIEAGIIMAVFLNGRINREFSSRANRKINFPKMADLLKVGLPAGIGLTVNVAFWGVVLIGLVSKFGKEAVAATSAVLSCTNVSVMPVVGIATALTAAVGKSIGQGRKDIAIRQTGICLKVAMVYMGFMGLCFFLFRENLMNFWSSDSRVIEIGVKILICAAVFQLFDAAMVIYTGSLRGAGDTAWLAGISALGAFLILGLGGLTMVIFFAELGSLGPWIAATANIIAIGLANRRRFKSNQWMRIDLFKRRPVGEPLEIEAVVK